MCSPRSWASNNEVVIEKQTKMAREVLREKFLAADIGVSGANFLIADSGAVVVVENEGNARLSTSAPQDSHRSRGHRKGDSARAGSGGVSEAAGPQRDGPAADGLHVVSIRAAPRETKSMVPDEFYLVLLDNGRTKLLADQEKRQSLYCIRCGACLNHCPVYRKIGGHNYPWVYSGPIGAIITPQFHGVTSDPWLPFASSLCGACAEVCPVKIEIPKLLLKLREEVVEVKRKQDSDGMERFAFQLFAWIVTHPKIYVLLASLGSLSFRLVPKIGPLKKWASQRTVPEPARQNFHQYWASRVGPKETRGNDGA